MFYIKNHIKIELICIFTEIEFLMITIIAKVNPGSKKEQFMIMKNGEYHIKIRAKPIHGEANEYLIQFLADKLQLRKSDISILKGLSSRIKKIQLNIDEIQWQKIISDLNN